MKTTKTILMPPAEELVRQEIERLGPISFMKFIDIALYHPLYGYYNRTAPQRGRAGDYFTSLQVSDLFPRIFAGALEQMADALGSDQFTLIEIGSGNGEYLEGVLKAFANRPRGLRVWAVERSRPARDQLVKRLSRFPRCQVVASIDDIEWMGTLEGCIFSNEFFDALPFQRLQNQNGRWNEIMIGLDGGNLVEIKGEGPIVESRPQILDIYKEWSGWLSRGYVMTVDYGHPREALLSPSRANGTMIGYYKHQANKTPFEHIGEQDLTAHVDFSQLVEAGRANGFEPLLYCSQGIFLSHLGQKIIEEFLEGAPAAERRKRASAVQQLVHPDAMGETFWTLLQAKGVGMPAGFKAVPNRLRRLL